MTVTAADRAEAYAAPRRALHWAIALLLLAQIPLGIVFTDFDNMKWADAAFGKGAFNTLYDLHKSIGVTVLALMALRLAAKWLWPDPGHTPPLPRFNRIASKSAHGALYALLIVAPLLGWAGVSAYRAPVPVFGLFEAPPLLAKDRALSETLLSIHGALGLAILAIAAVHVAAALHHGFVRRDGVLSRMWPGARR